MTRKPSETIMISDNVSVTVLGIKGNQVRVGINAPKHIAVHREEIYLRIQEEGNHKPVDAPLDLITERLRLLDDADSEEYQLLYKLHSLLS